MVSDPGYSFCLGIGRLQVAVFCPDENSHRRLSARYVDFLVDSKPLWQLKLHFSALERQETIPAGLSFVDEQLWIQEAGGWGWISGAEMRGELVLGLQASEGTVDYFLRAAFALQAFEAGGLMLHAAGVIKESKAVCFFGQSGRGKTTVSRLSPPGSVLNDDLILLLPDEENWIVYGTPFTNPTQVKPSNRSAPLAGLYRLVQDREVFLESIPQSQALAELLACLPVIPADQRRSRELIPRLLSILAKFPVMNLHFRQNSSFWTILN